MLGSNHGRPDFEPRGFLGAWPDRSSLEPDGERRLALPGPARLDLRAILDGPDAEETRLDAVLIDGWREEFGSFESGVSLLAERLSPGGSLLLDLRDPRRPESLRRMLGIVGDPAERGERMLCPELDIELERALDALDAAGLRVVECVRVPSHERWPTGLSKALESEGLEPLWIQGRRPLARHWIRAERSARCAGTVLAFDLEGEVGRPLTETEVLHVDLETIDREFIAASGEWIFVTSTLDWRALAELRDEAVRSDRPSRLAGTAFRAFAIRRRDFLLAGPVRRPEIPAETALHDWILRLTTAGRPFHEVEREDPPRPLPEPSSQGLRALLDHWSPTPPTFEAPAAPRLSACLIVRDEARFLPDCLGRLASWVDELIVVDTGSTDETVALAELVGAKVFHHEWKDDFSAARQFALDQATGDWILQIDADEMVEPDDALLVRKTIERAGVGACNILLRNLQDDGESLGPPIWLTRMFRRLEGLRYEGSIHEQIGPSLARALDAHSLECAELGVTLTHLGAQSSVRAERSKTERNQALFGKALSERPNDPYLAFLYSDHLRAIGETEDADHWLTQSVTLLMAMNPAELRTRPYASEAASRYADRLLHLDATEDAWTLCDEFLRHATPTPNLLRSAAETALRLGRCFDAIRLARRLRAWRGRAAPVLVSKSVTDLQSATIVAEAYRRLGRTDLAVHEMREVADAFKVERAHDNA